MNLDLETTTMSPTGTSGLETGFCVECQSLRLDDKECGGWTATSKAQPNRPEMPVLSFKRTPTVSPIPWLTELSPQVRADYSPDFPKLADASAVGCEFCGILRTAILEANIAEFEKEGIAAIRLYYYWGILGPIALVGKMGINREPGLLGFLHFAIYSRDSRSLPWVGLEFALQFVP
ncbi:hypothetical protein N658DRAFT_74810 [Parathielavia hyrcaniae]|uniref:Uncharacterized protein n=1 Tax=Parathielavia hyrcaniae TaxID=113614 RepID=A0AAN6PZR8_9PEZI|nr:hypothetical protein N658DRAFT_74810 [Parathielavia hyrcaniae]